MAALKSAPVTTVSLARFVLETQLKRCDKMKRDGWCSEWGIGQSLDWWSGLKNQKQKAKYGMYLCALLIDKQNDMTPPPAHATIYRNVSALPLFLVRRFWTPLSLQFNISRDTNQLWTLIQTHSLLQNIIIVLKISKIKNRLEMALPALLIYMRSGMLRKGTIKRCRPHA